MIEITDLKREKDDLYVYGTVDGVPSVGHGLVSRIEGVSDDVACAYVEEVLAHGKTADLDALKHVVPAYTVANLVHSLKRNWLLTLFIAADALMLLAHYLAR
jgi:hypothetical protein